MARTEELKRAVACKRASQHTVADIAEELNLSPRSVRSILEDSETTTFLAAEQEKLRIRMVRERTLMALKTGEYRKNMDRMAMNADHPKHYDANKLMLEYTVGPPVQRHALQAEHSHALAPDQFADLIEALRDANAKVVEHAPDPELRSGKEALPDAHDIAERSVEGQLEKRGNGSV